MRALHSLNAPLAMRDRKAGDVPGFFVASTPKSYDSFKRRGGRLLHNAMRADHWCVFAVARFLPIAAALWPHWPSIVLPFHRHVRQPRPSARIADAASAIPPQGFQRGRSTSSGMGGLNACRCNSPIVFRWFRRPLAAVTQWPDRARARRRLSRVGLDVSGRARRARFVSAAAALGAAQPVCRHWALRVRGAPQAGLAERRRNPQRGLVGTMLVGLSSGMLAYGMRTVGTGTAAVMVATVPLFATVIAAVAGRKIGRGEWFAVGLGLVGIAILSQGSGAPGSAGGSLAILCGALFWAGGAHLAGRLKLPSDLFISTSLQIGLGGAMSTHRRVGVWRADGRSAFPAAAGVLST